MNKKARDNRANQMNPNNKAYWKSRSNNYSNNRSRSNNYSNRTRSGNLGKPCRICGRRGKLEVHFTGVSWEAKYYVKCGYCGGTWWLK